MDTPRRKCASRPHNRADLGDFGDPGIQGRKSVEGYRDRNWRGPDFGYGSDGRRGAAVEKGAAMEDSRSRKGRTLVLVPSYADVERLEPLVPGARFHRPHES